ncbi:hypothetical protein K493DRAFT_389532, partial [Basidiobolus meristosporus CBS 931.73]
QSHPEDDVSIFDHGCDGYGVNSYYLIARNHPMVGISTQHDEAIQSTLAKEVTPLRNLPTKGHQSTYNQPRGKERLGCNLDRTRSKSLLMNTERWMLNAESIKQAAWRPSKSSHRDDGLGSGTSIRTHLMGLSMIDQWDEWAFQDAVNELQYFLIIAGRESQYGLNEYAARHVAQVGYEERDDLGL